MNYFFNIKRQILTLSFLILLLFLVFGYLFHDDLKSFGKNKFKEITAGNDRTKVIKILNTSGREERVITPTDPIIAWEANENIFDWFFVHWNYIKDGPFYHSFREGEYKKYSDKERIGKISAYRGDGYYGVQVCGVLERDQIICDRKIVYFDAPFYYDLLGGFYTPRGLIRRFSILFIISVGLLLIKKYFFKNFDINLSYLIALASLKISKIIKERERNKLLMKDVNEESVRTEINLVEKDSFVKKYLFIIILILISIAGLVLILVGYLMLGQKESAVEEMKDKINHVFN